MSLAETDANPPSVNAAICTLFEGRHHYGLAAFLNSLVRCGFRGTVWAGYRGALPPWIGQLQSLPDGEDHYRASEAVDVVFLPLTTEIHLTNYKPEFMLDLLAGPASRCEYLWYFDPDIWLRSPWSFFVGWQRHGIALCQEITNNILPHDSPLRHQWMEIAGTIGLSDPRPLGYYYNGGLAGVPAQHADFLLLWKQIIELSADYGCNLYQMMPGTREMPFHASDQDALNIAAMYTQAPLTTLGPEGMSFIPGGARMFHTVGVKPWNGSLLKRAFLGLPPSSAMKAFFQYCDGPIRAYSQWQLRRKRIACALAALIGRFYSRS
ncbi:MAG: hypothetical protein P4L03_04480 [Terracidiphilus sp.]|nr:hypothetical protein [Terracidiphilus sp.]